MIILEVAFDIYYSRKRGQLWRFDITYTKRKIIDLINRGAERARYCPNDPICSLEHEAHCFACLDLPETACIKFNAKLNRKLFLERWFNPRPNGLVL